MNITSISTLYFMGLFLFLTNKVLWNVCAKVVHETDFFWRCILIIFLFLIILYDLLFAFISKYIRLEWVYELFLHYIDPGKNREYTNIFLKISVEYGQYGKPRWFYSSKLPIFMEIYKRAQTINIPMKIRIYRNYCMFYMPIIIPV